MPTSPTSAKLSLSWHTVITLAIAILLGMGALRLVWQFARALAIVALAITIAEAVAPIAEWLTRWMKRSLAIVTVYLILLAAIAAVCWIVGPMIAQQVTDFMSNLPKIVSGIEGRLGQWLRFVPDSATREAMSTLGRWAKNLISLPLTIASGLITAIMIVILSYYWLIASPATAKFFRSLFPPARRDDVAKVQHEMGHVMGGYVRGVAIDATAVGLLSWTGMWLLGVDFAFALGVITALGEFIPYVGPFAAAVPAVLIALLQSPMKAVWTLVVYAGIQQIEGHLLTPNIMRRETNIPQPLVIIALFAGGSVGGILGALVSIPVAGACMVFVQRVVAPAIRDRWFDDSPATT